MAAEMAVGTMKDQPKRVLNLTQLRRNKRKRADRTAGRKQPRVHDVDIVPPDDQDPQIAADIIAAINDVSGPAPKRTRRN